MSISTFRTPWEVSSRDKRNKVDGVYIGIVTDNKDTTGKYRVKVRFPSLSNGDDETTFWCRIITFGAGKDRGMYCLPENGDEVLVSFVGGDMDNPILIGSLWNNDAAPHHDNKDGKNNWRCFKSRTGHYLEFSDEDSKGAIMLKTKLGAKVRLDDADNGKKIEIYDDSGDNYLLIDNTNKKIVMETKTGEMIIKAKDKIHIESKVIEIFSTQDTTIESKQANVNIKADQQNVNIDGSSAVHITGGGAKADFTGGNIMLNC